MYRSMDNTFKYNSAKTSLDLQSQALENDDMRGSQALVQTLMQPLCITTLSPEKKKRQGSYGNHTRLCN